MKRSPYSFSENFNNWAEAEEMSYYKEVGRRTCNSRDAFGSMLFVYPCPRNGEPESTASCSVSKIISRSWSS